MYKRQDLFSAELIEKVRTSTDRDLYPDTDWIGELLRKNTHNPVSYTHLDVYKRQAQTSTRPHIILIVSDQHRGCLLYTSCIVHP